MIKAKDLQKAAYDFDENVWGRKKIHKMYIKETFDVMPCKEASSAK